MSFSHPGAWHWASLTLVILLLYLVRFASRRREAANFWLWQIALDHRPAWFRLRFWFSLAAQIALLLLLVAALAQPYWKDAVAVRRSIVLVIDVSASMSASDVEPSRFGETLLIAQETIHSLQLGERMAILTAGSAVRTACQLTQDHERLLATLKELQPTGGQSRIVEAVVMGRRMLADQPNPRVYVISDGAFDGAADLAVAEDVMLHRVGQSGQNLAITRFEARPSALTVENYDVLIEIANFSDQPQVAPLKVSLGDRPVLEHDTELAAGEVRQTVQSVTVPDSSLLSARLDVSDDLPLDDIANLLVPSRRPPRVLLVTSEAPQSDNAIRSAIQSDPRIRLEETTHLNSLPDTAADVTIFHRQVPEQLPAGPVLVIDPRNSCDAWELAGNLAADGCRVQSYRSDSPLLSGVRIEDVVFEEAVQLDFTSPASTLVESVEGQPLYSLLDRPGGQVLVLHTSLQQDKSDLVLRADFPRLLVNAVWWLSRAEVVYRRGMTTSDVIQLKPSEQPRSFQTPDGRTKTLAARRSFALLDRPGVWQLQAESNSDSTADAWVLASNLVNHRESNLRASDDVRTGEFEKPVFIEEHPVWLQIVGVGLLLLIVEWICYHRRLVV